eukprot:scaffold225507_cov35-Prasinocladus_malaysianus.AAC.2
MRASRPQSYGVVTVASGMAALYHQRGWTLQEYCVTPNLVLDQESHPVQSPEPLLLCCRSSLTKGELSRYEEMREWYHARCDRSSPFWLYRGIQSHDEKDKEFVRKSYQKFKELCAVLHTHSPEDLIRALYPPLMNTPVENQDELVALMLQVQGITGEEESRLNDLLQGCSEAHPSLITPSVKRLANLVGG